MADSPEISPQETGQGPVHASDMAANEPAPPQTGDPVADRSLALKKELNTIPLTEDQIGEWWKQIERAEKRVENLANSWDILMKEYMPVVQPSSSPEEVKVNLHFRNVHAKIPKLFPMTPELQCEPAGPAANDTIPNPMMPGQMYRLEDIVPIKNAVLNFQLGVHGIKGTRLMKEMLQDALSFSGIFGCKIGYKCTFKVVQEPVMGPDPMAPPPMQQPGSMLGLQPQQPPQMVPQMHPITGEPMMTETKVPIHEEWYARRVSPKKLLFSADCHSTRFEEDASWKCHKFTMTAEQVKREYGIADEDMPNADGQDEALVKHDSDAGSEAANLITGYEIWYKSSVHAPDSHPNAVHPLAYNQLTLFKGMKTSAVHRPSPDQTFDDRGKLTMDSLIGSPVKIGSLRDLPDSPFPPADSAFTNIQVKELNTFRRQSSKIRDAAVGKYAYDEGALGEGELDRIKNGNVGDFIGMQAGALANGLDKIIAATPQLTQARDDMRSATILKQDLEETLGISGPQAGAPTDTVRSATELDQMAQSSNERLEEEEGRAVEFYIELAAMLDQLLMRYADNEYYVNVTGQSGVQTLAMWNKSIIAGRFLYTMTPDSQRRIDAARDRQQELAFYTSVAPDPLVNRVPVLRRLARKFNHDPAKIIADVPTMMAQPPHGGGGPDSRPEDNSGEKPNAPGTQGHDRDARKGGEGA